MVLRTPYQDEPKIKSYLARLSISLEARAYGKSQPSTTNPDERSPLRNEDIVWSGTVDTGKEPFVAIRETDVGDEHRILLATWNVSVKLSMPKINIVWLGVNVECLLDRPRIRLQSPMVEFRVSGILGPGKEQIEQLQDPYLLSGVPASVNLLEPLSHDPTLKGLEPKLTASRLSRVQPWDRGIDVSSRVLKPANPSRFPAVPAISSRVHYTRSRNLAGKASLIASLDLETSPFSDENIELAQVTMTLSEGLSEDLVSPRRPGVPWICRPKDVAVYLFRLTLDSSLPDGLSATAAQMVEINVEATVLTSDTCRPKVHMRWKTGVDFSGALNPTFGAPGQSMQRGRRPTSLPVTPGVPNTNTVPVSAREDDEGQLLSPSGPRTRQRATSVGDLGITVTFTAPNTVRVGQPFAWNILVVNGSSRPRRLAITTIPRRRRDWKGHAPKSSTASIGSLYNRDGDTAEAVIDENVLYAMQRNSTVASESQSQVLCLSTDVRIGPLNPGSCVDTKLEFMPLAEGFLQIEAVRVVDVGSGDAVDIRDLPDIVAEERES